MSSTAQTWYKIGQIFVKDGWKTITIQDNWSHDTVDLFLCRVLQTLEIIDVPHRSRLMWGGKQLEKGTLRTLGEYGIQNESTVFLLWSGHWCPECDSVMQRNALVYKEREKRSST
jgi:hypothetical protein